MIQFLKEVYVIAEHLHRLVDVVFYLLILDKKLNILTNYFTINYE